MKVNPLDVLPDLPDVPEVNVPNPMGNRRLSFIGNRHLMRELAVLMQRVSEIETACADQQHSLDEIQDEFKRLKLTLYTSLDEVKRMIRNRLAVQQERGNTMEVIQSGARIKDILVELDRDFNKMKEVYRRQSKQKKKFTEEEMQSRFQMMQFLKVQISEARDLFHHAHDMPPQQVQTLTDFRNQLAVKNAQITKTTTNRDLTADEREVLDRWAKRDAELDKGIKEVGDVVDRLGDIADDVGTKAAQQRKAVGDLNLQMDEANEDLLEINMRIKDIMGKGNSFNLVMKLVLSLILVGLIGYILNTIMGMMEIA